MRNPSSTATAPPPLLLAWLHLAVLWTFAVARPLFEVLQNGPEFFVARGNTSADIIVFALVLTLVPPTVLVACEALLFRFRGARRALHLAFVGLLLATIVVQVVGDWGSGLGEVVLGASVLIGVAGAFAYARTRFAPTIVTALGPAPVVFLALFLLFSPVSKLVLPQDEGTASAEVRGSTSVIAVVFDEFAVSALLDRGGRIDPSRYPHFAALAKDATWYRNATTVADETTQAVPAILTGNRPEAGLLPIVSDHPQNLFTILGERYSLNVSEPATNLCPERLCGRGPALSAPSRLRALFDDLSVVSAHLLLPEDLEDGLPPVNRTFAGFRREGRDTPAGEGAAPGGLPAAGLQNRTVQFSGFLERLSDRKDGPRLDFLHLGLPHSPWEYLPSGQSYPVTGPSIPGVKGDRWGADAGLPTQAYGRYLLQLGLVDRLLGQLVRRLRRERLYDSSLLVVAADHGIGFQPGRGRRLVGGGSFAEIANVPLFIKAPRQQKGRIERGPARTIDILPTITDTIGVRFEAEFDGAALPRDVGPGEPVTVSTFGGGQERLGWAELIRDRDAELRRRIDLLGVGDGFKGVFAAGPRPDLVGRRVGRVAPSGSAGFRVELDFRREYSSFVPSGSAVPAFVTGRLTGSARGGEQVAIAVNGRIAGVTKSYRDGDTLRVGAMVSPAAFGRGANRVEALAITGSGAETRFARVGRAEGEQARLVQSGDGLSVVAFAEEPIPVEPGVADGFIDAVTVEGDRITVAGWTTDEPHGRPADRVLLFGDGRLLQASQPSAQRPDLVQLYGPGVALAGYEFSGVQASRSIAKRGRLRVIAIVGERASELEPGGANTFPPGS